MKRCQDPLILFPAAGFFHTGSRVRREGTTFRNPCCCRLLKRLDSRRKSRSLASGHTFSHSFAAPLLEDGYDIRMVQEFLEHRALKTTMRSPHVLNRGGRGVRSPADSLVVPPESENRRDGPRLNPLPCGKKEGIVLPYESHERTVTTTVWHSADMLPTTKSYPNQNAQ